MSAGTLHPDVEIKLVFQRGCFMAIEVVVSATETRVYPADDIIDARMLTMFDHQVLRQIGGRLGGFVTKLEGIEL